MDMQTHPRAETAPGDISRRAEKGSAFSLIRAEAKATNDKTARLRALRMEREEAVRAEAAAAPAPAPKRVRKRVAK